MRNGHNLSTARVRLRGSTFDPGPFEIGENQMNETPDYETPPHRPKYARARVNSVATPLILG
jgi:hypothetical protein